LHLGLTFPEGQYVRTRVLSDVKKGFESQLKRLGTDYIDFGFIHYVDDEADLQKVFDSGIFDYAQQLKREGKIRYLGIASHMADICLRSIETGGIDMCMFSVNAAYDLDPVANVPFEELDMSGKEQLRVSSDRIRLYQECEKRNIGIQVMKPLGGGLLLDSGTSPFGRAMTVPQCIQYALDRPAVISCLLGIKSEKELESALYYYSSSAEERDYSFIAGMRPAAMAGTCVYCNHCLPCPQGIDIGLVNKYLDLYQAGDNMAREHYRTLQRRAKDCIECGSCEKNCPFHVKIRDKMQKAMRTME
jgi:predicted aldo/keto reductase-like oxidoreductase